MLAVRADGDTLACINPGLKLVPASNMKLLTTGLALRELGPDFRFETALAYSGQIKDSTLVGDLYILGGGDPTTGASYEEIESVEVLFGRWLSILRSAGINSVDGLVIGDQRFMSSSIPESPAWEYEDIGAGYGAGPSGLNFFENKQTFYVSPGPVAGSTPSIYPRYPDTPWMQYAHSAVTSSPRSSNELFYENTPFGPFAAVRGSYPVDRRGYKLEASNRFGAYTCAFYFYRWLIGKGFPVSGGFADVSPSGMVRPELTRIGGDRKAEGRDKLTVIGRTLSPSLLEILTLTNCKSDNFFAETLFKTLSVRACGSAEYGDCRDVAEKAIARMGLPVEGFCRIYDGSGLSRTNYVSASFFVRFLKAMASSSFAEDYKSTLPQPGMEDTTLETRLKDAPDDVKARIHMKSGSMDGVHCFSGYIDSPDSNPKHAVIFSLLTDNVPGHSYLVYSMLDELIFSLSL